MQRSTAKSGEHGPKCVILPIIRHSCRANPRKREKIAAQAHFCGSAGSNGDRWPKQPSGSPQDFEQDFWNQSSGGPVTTKDSKATVAVLIGGGSGERQRQKEVVETQSFFDHWLGLDRRCSRRLGGDEEQRR